MGDPEPYPALQALPPSTGTFSQRVGDLPTEAQILAHGFDFHPDWWETRIGNPAWTTFFHDLPPATRGGDTGGSPAGICSPGSARPAAGMVGGAAGRVLRVGYRRSALAGAAPGAGLHPSRSAAVSAHRGPARRGR
ncbi:protein of unknown function [Blastococcus saxobsidens DD2]|uniref:Uncharacterized protein n=1 Tax=Blastococcus saxobsidens (strain DD2) TaxID=1146883 RepID=H6RNX0_BLASD|nr:protein of unknown function [Blastococcus saxobsidens DD2]